jgi:hypothetical protein
MCHTDHKDKSSYDAEALSALSLRYIVLRAVERQHECDVHAASRWHPDKVQYRASCLFQPAEIPKVSPWLAWRGRRSGKRMARPCTSVCESLMLHTPVNAWHVGRNGVRSVRNNAAFNPIGNDQARFERELGLYYQFCVEGKYPGGVPVDRLVIGIDPGYINVSQCY